MSNLILNIAKVGLEIGGWVARHGYLNWRIPRVGRIVRDIAYGPDPRHRLDVIVPAGTGPWPVVVNAHGGALIALSKDIATPICCELAREGVLVINMSYRLAPRHLFPAPMEDMALALAWTREHATEYDGDPDGIFLAGQSAGGLVAAWLGVALAKPELFDAVGIAATAGPDGVRGLLLFYGVFDAETVAETSFPFVKLLPKAILGDDPTDRTRRAALASPRRHVTAATPPAFLCCGEIDSLFPQSREMHEALEAAGAEHETLFFARDEHPEAGHAFVQFPGRKCGRMAVAEAIAFVRRRVRAPSERAEALGERDHDGEKA